MPGRSDGTRIERLPPLRRLMPFLTPRRNDAYVLFEQTIPTAPLRALLERLNAGRADGDRVTSFHCVLRATGMAITNTIERPMSWRTARMTPTTIVIGAAIAIVHPITTSICTCCTSFVMRVISDGAPNVPTSRAEKSVT